MKKTVIILCLLFLCGCSYTEPDAVFTVSAVGFSVESGETVAYVQFINASEKNSLVSPTFTVKGSGEDEKQAIDEVRAKLSKKPSFSHCRIIALSDRLDLSDVSSVLLGCSDLGVPLRAPVVCCNNINELFNNELLSSGQEIEGLIRQNAEYFGYGGHTALFEIQTALLVNEGKFGLPILKTDRDSVFVEGLYYFTNGLASIGGNQNDKVSG